MYNAGYLTLNMEYIDRKSRFCKFLKKKFVISKKKEGFSLT